MSAYTPVGNVYDKSADLFRREKRLSHPEWLDNHFKLVAESSGIPGDWATYPCQKAVAHTFVDDDIQLVVVQKCTRWGYTKLKAATELRACTDLNRNVIAYQPSDEDADGYYKDELQPALDVSPFLNERMMVSSAYEKSPLNRSDRIAFRGGVLHNLGGKSSKNYRRRTGDLVTIDEIDEFDESIGQSKDNKQGSAVILSARAITDSPFKKQIVGSSPTIRGRSLIERQILLIDEVFKRYVPCPHCDEAIQLLFGDFESDYGIKIKNDDPSTAMYLCPCCSSLFTWQDMQDIDAHGEYRSDNYIIRDLDGMFINHDRHPVQKCKEIGFKINALFSRYFTWEDAARQYLKAHKDAELGNYGSLITFTNHVEGETYEEIDAQAISPTKFQEDHQIIYRAALPSGVRMLTATLDLAGTYADITHVGWGLEEVSWFIKHTQIVGDIQSIEFWNRVQECLDQYFDHEDSGQAQAYKCVLDAGYNYDVVTKFCKRNPLRYLPARGLEAKQGQPLYEWPASAKKGYYFFRSGGDAALERMRFCYVIKHDKENPENIKAGQVHFPQYHARDPLPERGFSKEYFKQLLSDRRIEKRVRGKVVWTWEPPDKVRNDASDCARLNYVAYRIAVEIFGLKIESTIISPIAKSGSTDVYDRMKELAGEIYGGN